MNDKGNFKVVSVNISRKKGIKKEQVEEALLKEDFGLEGDAHGGPWHRQVSLLAEEDIDYMRSKGITLQWGDFAENITTRGVELDKLPVGTRITLGGCVLEVTQIGKECHHGCAIYHQVGECIMPKKGIFARVLSGGLLKPGDTGIYQIP